MEDVKPATNTACLRIHSENLTAEKITEILNTEPDGLIVKGAKAVPDHPKSYIYPSHMWRLDSNPDEAEPLDRHISRLADFIESRENEFKQLQADCEFDIFCGYFANDWTGHLELSPELLKKLTILPVKILIELY